jgi:hypothetical protein
VAAVVPATVVEPTGWATNVEVPTIRLALADSGWQ